MQSEDQQPVIRNAIGDDIAAICQFGETYIPPHYAPLIGEAAAAQQVRDWWNETHIEQALARGTVVIAEAGNQIIGVGQRGLAGSEHVIYKLYVHPAYRSRGLGPRLIDALVAQLPPGVDRLFIEHLAGNERAAAFYQRQGFAVDRTDSHPTGERALAQVWRVRTLPTERR